MGYIKEKIFSYFLAIFLLVTGTRLWVNFFERGTISLLLDIFGKPESGEIGLSFAIITFFSSIVLGGAFSALLTTIILHRLGLRWKISVFKPTLFGFLTFLLLLFLYILYLGR